MHFTTEAVTECNYRLFDFLLDLRCNTKVNELTQRQLTLDSSGK